MERIPREIKMFLPTSIMILFNMFKSDPLDPVKNCEFHKDKPCTHVDGPNCDMKTCCILKEYKENKSKEE
jgi:hypothetical protein